MTLEDTGTSEDRLTLRADLEDIAQVPPWIERLALKHAILESVQFAINVCLEEALANIILHGYGAGADKTMVVRFAVPRKNYYLFLVEDRAPCFNPLDRPELPALNPDEQMRIGGQGVRLLRQFADTLEYERMPDGNRLKIGFSAKPSVRSDGSSCVS